MKYLIYILLFISISIQVDAVNMRKKPYTYDKQNVKTYFGKDSLLGLEDLDGNKLTPAIYTEMGSQSMADMIIVEVDDSLYGMINTKGEPILPPIYNYIYRPFGEDPILKVEKGGEKSNLKYNKEKGCFDTVPTPKPKLSVIDSLKSIYEEAKIIGPWGSWYSGGCAEIASDKEIHAVCADGSTYGIKDTLAYHIKKDGKYYILSKDKKAIITEGRTPVWSSNFSDSTFFACNKDTLIVIDFKKQKVIDKQTINQSYDTITNINGDKERITTKYSKRSNSFVKIRTKAHKFLNRISNIKDSYVITESTISKGKILYYEENINNHVRTYKDGRKKYKYGVTIGIPTSEDSFVAFIKVNAIPYKYDQIYKEEDLYIVKKGNRLGMFSSKCKRMSRCKYDRIKFDDKSNFFFVENRFEKTGIYSSSGKKIIPVRYEDIDFDEKANCFFVENRFEKTGIYSSSGKKIIPVRYEDINFDVKSKCFFVENRFDKTGVYSSSGKKIIPCKYKKIELIENETNNYFKAKISDNQYEYFSITGKKLPQIRVNN